ncbi:MAG TPA: hypothetical protein VFW64_14355 [Pseudonocardiaceae bacterium]|nr:hypothetical protein [Pseudonocardiaceae bacterium]
MREAAEWCRELPDGRVVTGGDFGGDGRVLMWDPGDPGAVSVELGCHEGGVTAVAVLPDGRVVTGGYDDRVRLRNVQSRSTGTLLACSAHVLATFPSPSGARLPIGHAPGRSFMLEGRRSGTEHAWSPATAVRLGSSPAAAGGGEPLRKVTAPAP